MHPIIRRILPSSSRRRLRLWLDSFFCRDDLAIERVGTANGWWIATGLLGANSCVLSGGAGNDISFETQLKQRTGCRIALFDPSPTGQATFELVPAAERVGLSYFAVGLSGTSEVLSFDAPRDAVEGSFSLSESAGGARFEFECLAPADALAKVGFNSIDLLKLDIEGSEYGFLATLIATEHRPAQIAVEFHHFLPSIPFRRTWAVIRSLRRAGYLIAHKEQCDYLFIHERILNRSLRK